MEVECCLTMFSLARFENSDSDIQYYMGFPTLDVFNACMEHLKLSNETVVSSRSKDVIYEEVKIRLKFTAQNRSIWGRPADHVSTKIKSDWLKVCAFSPACLFRAQKLHVQVVGVCTIASCRRWHLCLACLRARTTQGTRRSCKRQD